MDNKKRISLCPNFYKIINFPYEQNDFITEKIINIYRSYVFNREFTTREEILRLKTLDHVLSKYISDYNFRKEINLKIQYMEFMTTKDIVKSFVDNIIDIYDKYLEGTTKRIYIARWI